MCDQICDVITSLAIRVKSTHLTKLCLKTRKNRNMTINNIFHINLHLKNRLHIKFTACWGEPQEVLTSFTVS